MKIAYSHSQNSTNTPKLRELLGEYFSDFPEDSVFATFDRSKDTIEIFDELFQNVDSLLNFLNKMFVRIMLEDGCFRIERTSLFKFDIDKNPYFIKNIHERHDKYSKTNLFNKYVALPVLRENNSLTIRELLYDNYGIFYVDCVEPNSLKFETYKSSSIQNKRYHVNLKTEVLSSHHDKTYKGLHIKYEKSDLYEINKNDRYSNDVPKLKITQRFFDFNEYYLLQDNLKHSHEYDFNIRILQAKQFAIQYLIEHSDFMNKSIKTTSNGNIHIGDDLVLKYSNKFNILPGRYSSEDNVSGEIKIELLPIVNGFILDQGRQETPQKRVTEINSKFILDRIDEIFNTIQSYTETNCK